MSNDKKVEKIVYRTQGTTFLELLTLLFIGLKLAGYIDWSWWWVFSPIWITALLVIFLAVPLYFYLKKHL